MRILREIETPVQMCLSSRVTFEQWWDYRSLGSLQIGQEGLRGLLRNTKTQKHISPLQAVWVVDLFHLFDFKVAQAILAHLLRYYLARFYLI